MTAVEFRDVTKAYGHAVVLDKVSFSLPPETLGVLFGPPGCGKSIALRLLTGLEAPTGGRVLLRGEDVTGLSPAERNIGYVPQSFALYPHYKVYDNIAYPLRLIGAPDSETKRMVQRAADMLHIAPLLDKRPNQLSGGEKQRVALARGITKPSDIYVLDDPLAGLDFKLREQLFDDLKQLRADLHATFIYTTSDPLETLILADQLVVLDKGKVIETGQLEQVYANPRHVRTMALLGFPRTNLLSGRLIKRGTETWCKTLLFEFPVKLGSPAANDAEVSVAVRPQDVIVDPGEVNGFAAFEARIVLQEDLGSELEVYLDAQGLSLLSVVRHDEAHVLREGAVKVGIARNALKLYSAEQGLQIGQGAA